MTVEEESRRPRRPALLVAAWVVTAALAIAVSSWAVGLASRQVTDPIPLTALSGITRSIAPSADPASAPPAASPAASPAESPAPAAPPPPAAATTTRTVNAIGGRASFRFEGDRVTLDWATPSAGFEVDVEEHGSELRVRFRGDDHESRVFASVRGGEPATRVEERADDA